MNMPSNINSKSDKMTNWKNTNPLDQRSEQKIISDKFSGHILSPMRSQIQNIHTKKKDEESNIKITEKSNKPTTDDCGSQKSKSDSLFGVGKSSFDFMDKGKNEVSFSEKKLALTLTKVSSNENKSEDIFDNGKSSFDFIGNADENEFSMNFDDTMNSNFQFTNFDFGNEENNYNDNSFTFNFGENSEESKKNDAFSLF